MTDQEERVVYDAEIDAKAVATLVGCEVEQLAKAIAICDEVDVHEPEVWLHNVQGLE